MPPGNVARSILLDVSAALNQGAGIGRYARELTRRLIPLLPESAVRLWYAPDDPLFDPLLLDSEPWSTVPGVRSPLSRRNVDRLYFRLRLPISRTLRLGRPSDIYSPDFTAPSMSSSNTHVTVHDLAWLHPEARTPPPLARFLGPVVARSVRSAATVFAVSETVRQEMLDIYELADHRVIVAPNAADDRFFDAVALDPKECVTFGVPRPFLLYVGAIEPRKNLQVLFDALRWLPTDLVLVLAGKSGWNAAAILECAQRPELATRVVQLGYVPDRLLPGLVATAEAVVYPSRYEGFGLPIIEGLAAGTPVVASDLPVFREVGGEEVCYFDPDDPRDAVRAIESALESTEAGPDARLRRKSQASRFDWRRSAEIVANRLLEKD